MLCPKCHLVSDERFCPRCGLDLQIYDELATLKVEVESLRQLLIAGVQPGSETAQEVAGARESGSTPPPLPPLAAAQAPWHEQVTARRTQPKKNVQRGGLAEIAVGQKWLLGIGVLILIIGIGFFLKYAFDQEWIGPAVRISIGFVGGILLLLGASICHRRKLRGLDIGIGAVGLGTLYLTSYAACQVDHLLPAALALLLILLITATGASLAALWASQAVAILTFLGGYLAPLLFASAQFDPWLFLGYLFILTIGGQILAYAKDWKHLYSSSAALTWVSLAVWAQRDYRKDWFLGTFVFTQVLFVAYSVMPFVRAALRKEKSWSWGFLLAVINGLFCCWYSESLLNYEKSAASLVSLSYAVGTLALALVFWRGRSPSLLSSWLIAQAAVFLLVFSEQILTSQSWVTIFWAAELVVLYWSAAKSNDRTLLFVTFLIGLLVVLQYFVTANDFIFGLPATASFTEGVFSRWSAGLSMVVSLLFIVWLDRTGHVAAVHPQLNHAFELLGVLSLFGFANMELDRFTNQFIRRIELTGVSVLWSIFAVGLMLVGVWKRRKVYRISAIALLVITVLKVLAFDTAEVSTPYRILSCLVLGAILVAVSFLYYRFSERLFGK
jgi:uncharacterized membrane protein